MPRAKRVCPTSGCPELTDGGRCPGCVARADRARGTAAERGYDERWARRRAAYLRSHPFCVLMLDGCTYLAQVADHYPTSRRDLVRQRVADPDADDHLRSLCRSCDTKQTAQRQPGGWHGQQ